MLNYVHLSKSDMFSTRLISETKSVTPNFYVIFETSKSLSVRGRSLKKIYRVENFRANVSSNERLLRGIPKYSTYSISLISFSMFEVIVFRELCHDLTQYMFCFVDK